MKIGIIGAGNLGLSIAQGLLISDKITTLYLTKNKTSAQIICIHKSSFPKLIDSFSLSL